MHIKYCFYSFKAIYEMNIFKGNTAMWFLEKLVYVFLLPGTLAIKAVGITLEEDGGIFRSMINMLFWGTVCMPFVLALSLRGMGH